MKRWILKLWLMRGWAQLHLQEMLAYYGDPEGLVLSRKHLRRYFKGLAVRPILQKMLKTSEVAEFERLLLKVEEQQEQSVPQIVHASREKMYAGNVG